PGADASTGAPRAGKPEGRLRFTFAGGGGTHTFEVGFARSDGNPRRFPMEELEVEHWPTGR
ncbi:MAG: hypothetical protein ACRDL4_12635, partial [Thermoleophilaceae bacterium]